MYPVSDQFTAALRNPHAVAVRVDAYLGDTLLVGDLPIVGGAVTVHGGTGVRRTLDLSVADVTLWPTLDVQGVELHPYRGIRFPDGREELVPLGRFSLDSTSKAVGPDGSGITVRSAPDRWARVQRARFLTPQSSVRTNTIAAEAIRLVQAAVPGVAYRSEVTNGTLVGALVWDRERDKAVNDLVTSIAADLYFDNLGEVVLAPAPLLSAPAVWTVDASPTGVLLGGQQTRDRSRTYNVVVASPSAINGLVPFTPQIASDTDSTSPTWVGGPFGQVPFFWSSPTLRNTTQALAAAQTILNRVKAVNAQLTAEQVVHPGLDHGDVVIAVLPDGTAERHLLDSVVIPLDVAGVQQLEARSSRPEGDVPSDE